MSTTDAYKLRNQKVELAAEQREWAEQRQQKEQDFELHMANEEQKLKEANLQVASIARFPDAEGGFVIGLINKGAFPAMVNEFVVGKGSESHPESIRQRHIHNAGISNEPMTNVILEQAAMGSPGYYGLTFRNPVVIPPYSHKIFRVFLRSDTAGKTFNCEIEIRFNDVGSVKTRGEVVIKEAEFAPKGNGIVIKPIDKQHQETKNFGIVPTPN